MSGKRLIGPGQFRKPRRAGVTLDTTAEVYRERTIMRDEFDKKTSEILAKRVGFRCSNPDCRRLTSGPRKDPAQAVNVGVASHITAASPGGPRFDPALAQKQRRSANNGIWLCQTHAKLIDNDPQLYTVELLLEWKRDAEERARGEIQGHGLSATEAAPIFMVPITRNPYFTGREDVLRELAATLAAQGAAALGQAEAAQLPRLTRAAISGLGGIGKTQIAVEYAYRHRDAYRAVFFVRADTESELVSGYATIAREIGLPEAAEQDQAAAVAAVQRWLTTNDGWLLILDNADDPKIVKPFLPAQIRGHVLVTSRAPSFAALGIGDPLRIATLSPAEALDFLLTRVARRDTAEPERQAAAKLAAELGYLPLALEQAGAYLVEHQDSFVDYLESYRRRGLELLARGAPEVDGHPDPVTTTWSLNFQEVEVLSAASADVLRASAFLAPDEIPEELLTDGGTELGSAIAAIVVGGDPLVVGELLAPLLRYSLVQRDSVGRTWSIHRMVQRVVEWSLGDARDEWVGRVVKALNRVFPWPNLGTWPLCDQFLPHVRAVARLAMEGEELAWLLGAGGKYLKDRARFAEAEPLYTRSLALLEKLRTTEDFDVGASLNNLAELYRAQGRLGEAEPLYARAIIIFQQTLGEEHPSVAASLNNLAELYRTQSRWGEAELLYAYAIVIFEKVRGKEHPDVATGLNNLALLYWAQGRLGAAEFFFTRSLTIFEKIRGKEHPDVATGLNNLATLYADQDRLEEAELLYARSLAIREHTLGHEHPDIAESLNNLATLYFDRGQLAKAEPLYARSLAINERFLGKDHPNVAQCLNNLASLYCKQDRLAEAESHFIRSLAIREKALGAEHPLVATALNNLANFYADQGWLAEAEPLLTRSLAIREKAFGAEHPFVATTLNNLARLYRDQGRVGEADELEARAHLVRYRHLESNPREPEQGG